MIETPKFSREHWEKQLKVLETQLSQARSLVRFSEESRDIRDVDANEKLRNFEREHGVLTDHTIGDIEEQISSVKKAIG